MIHLDIIKYILNPLLNWNDCELINGVHSTRFHSISLCAKKKHYSKLNIKVSTTYMFDDSVYTIEIYANGSKSWYKEGYLHREDKDVNTGLTLPTSINSDGNKCWYKDGEAHRTDKDLDYGLTLPAYIWSHGLKLWFQFGKQYNPDTDEDGLMLPTVVWGDW